MKGSTPSVPLSPFSPPAVAVLRPGDPRGPNTDGQEEGITCTSLLFLGGYLPPSKLYLTQIAGNGVALFGNVVPR